MKVDMAVWVHARPEQAKHIDSDWVETARVPAPQPIEQLMGSLSYGASYVPAVADAARLLGIHESDFCYSVRANELAEKEVTKGLGTDGSFFLGIFEAHSRARAMAATERSIDRLRDRIRGISITLGEGDVSPKGVRKLYKRVGLASLEAAETLIATRPVELPIVSANTADALARSFDQSGASYARRETLDEKWLPTVERVAQAMRETATGEGVDLAVAVESAFGALGQDARETAMRSRIWVAPSAADDMKRLAHKVGATADQVCKMLGETANYRDEGPLELPVVVVGDVAFVQGAGRQGLIAAVDDTHPSVGQRL
jgi:hypothetical protein